MADLAPFRGLRFGPGLPLGRAVCPPYDIIGPSLARRLRRRAENAIAIELPGPAGPAHARGVWRAWLRKGILVRDERPSYTLLSQEFRRGGKKLLRLGLFGALSLEPPGSKGVLAHERTLSKPKRDRLRLLASLKANTSPIFGAVGDPDRRLARLLRRLAAGPPEHDFLDTDGGRVKTWRIDSPAEVLRLRRALGGRQILIADGHHRYLVAWRYSRLLKTPGSRRVLAYLASEEDPGLLVLPTHRVVTPRARIRGAIEKRLSRECRMAACGSALELERRLARARPLSFGLSKQGRLWLCSPRAGRLPRYGGGLARLDVQWVRRLLSGIDPSEITYIREASEAARLARRRKGWAFLLKPPSLAGIRAAVRETGLLPQKSTYFYPKVPTGIVFRDLGAR